MPLRQLNDTVRIRQPDTPYIHSFDPQRSIDSMMFAFRHAATKTCTSTALRRCSKSPLLLASSKRWNSVVILSDMEAVQKFQQLHDKSICYFTATWCPPCKQIKPIYEEMSDSSDGVAFGLIDVDDNAEAAAEHGIQSVPTFIAFKGDAAAGRFSGADPGQLTNMVKSLQEDK